MLEVTLIFLFDAPGDTKQNIFSCHGSIFRKKLVDNRRALLFTAHVHCSLTITVLKLWSFFFLTVSGHLEYFDGWFYDLFTVFLSCQIPQKRDTVFFFFFPFKIFFGIDWCKVAIITPPSQLEAKTKRICVDMKQSVSGKNMTPILVASHEKCTFIFMFRDVVENHKKKKRLE